jgi:quercetin dioxygenase-like cupin family protein
MRNAQLLTVVSLAATVAAGCADDTPTQPEVAYASVQDHPGMNAAPTGVPAQAGGFFVEPLARGNFLDDVDVTVKIQLSNATSVVHVREPSDALVARITFQPGGSVGWHTHPGPVFVTVASGALSIINASDCVHRVYTAGKAFVDPGQGNVHVGFNDTDGETVLYATFLDVPAGQPATIPADDPGCAT